MNIKQSLIERNKYSIKCPNIMDYQYVTYHNTDNDAPAINEINYMKSNNNQVSFHIAVDDVESIQAILLNRNCWAAGDGSNGNGNRKSVHVEICLNKLGINNSRFKQAENNAVQVCAKLLYDKRLGIDRLKPHKYWSGKNCPSTTNHKEFENKVKIELGKLSQPQTKKYKNCILYGSEADRVGAEIINWSKEDCIVKNIKDHIAWEGENLFIIGGPAETILREMNTKEKYTAIVGSDRYETIRKCLEKVDK